MTDELISLERAFLMTMYDLPASPPTTDGALLSLVYTSVATVSFSEVDLALLLAVSRANNTPRDITGLLLYSEGSFIQALEGPERAVRRTLATIAADTRHRDVRTVDEITDGDRRFGSWAMGYQAVPDHEHAEAAWFGSPEAVTPHDGSQAAKLLALFRQH